MKLEDKDVIDLFGVKPNGETELIIEVFDKEKKS